MKLIALFIFTALMQVQATGLAQQITLNKNSVNLKDIFLEINKQTGYNVLWSSKEVGEKVEDVHFKNTPLAKALDYMLKDMPFTYTIQDKTVLIKEKEQVVTTVEQPAVMLRKITGKVVDESGKPLPGASITVKGTTRGTVSKPDGSFTLDVNAGEVLTISFVGYIPADVTIAEQTSLNIVLKESVNTINQAVVVTALGIKKQAKSLAYNVQEVNGDELTKVKDANFVNSLAGKVAGVTINASSTGVGGSDRVVMRGTKSISGNNNALYVVDGIPMPSLSSTQPTDIFTGMGQTGDGISSINPEDIEAVSVLSGPSAAALYGSDAANGVIMITTKRGSKDATRLTVGNSSEFSSPFVMPKFQNTYGSDPGNYYSWGSKLTTPSTYQPKDFFQTGLNITNNFSLSTGNEKNQTYLSFASVNAHGIIPNNNFDRYNFNIRNTTKFLNDKLEMDLGAIYVNTREQNMLAEGQYFNPLIPIYLFPRGEDITKYQTYERYDPTRNFKTQYWPYGDLGYQMQNPYWIINRDMFVNSKERYQLSGSFKYTINDWMNVVARARTDRNTSDNNRDYYASTSGLFAGPAGAYYNYNYVTNQVYTDALLNINKYIQDFNITANLGASLQDVVYKNSNFGGNLQSVPNLFNYNNLNLTQAQTSQNGYHDQAQSVFASTQVGWRSEIYLNASARTDWVSALANANNSRSIFYPSVGLSAVVSDLLKMNSKTLSFLKARLSYSEVGNAPQRFISNGTYPVINGYSQTSTFLSADIQPERTKSLEAGLNMMLWKGKVKLDVTAYKSSTYNQLFNPTLSTSSGFTNLYVNAGQIDNKGLEISAAVNQNIGPVKWTSNVVFSLNRNKIVKLLPAYTDPQTGERVSQDSLDLGGAASYKMILRPGGAMGDVYVNTLKTDEHGYIAVNLASQAVTANPTKFVKAGNANPDYNIGFRNSFTYKNFDIGFLVSARIGGVGVSVTQAAMDAFGVSQVSADARDNNGALVNGYRIPAQQYYQTIGGGTAGIGSMYVYSATNVRLGEATIGWNVPITKYVKFVKNLNISAVGRNLFMFYNKAPFDPESTANTGTYFQGIDYFMQPSLRTIGFSVKVSL
ncbi:SusC/RagA family TonB-linked outer membrane protein [Mucilaginibacter mali]|uniref:SusC/RagA family TonB-linked outer membrane protein n=1 Tax=Mucilaginibacter mali TaxID=2740462 RepID=A0A7D4QDM7_9SPHI|nr:SusC/RagA family TonB-linked outer membrane protein [Mucilaginibacter mali]QKJ29012.1 SusC/RagA family TonB-linked outer membrane protein [Mucilaginibacter mali]